MWPLESFIAKCLAKCKVLVVANCEHPLTFEFVSNLSFGSLSYRYVHLICSIGVSSCCPFESIGSVCVAFLYFSGGLLVLGSFGCDQHTHAPLPIGSLMFATILTDSVCLLLILAQIDPSQTCRTLFQVYTLSTPLVVIVRWEVGSLRPCIIRTRLLRCRFSPPRTLLCSIRCSLHPHIHSKSKWLISKMK